MVPSLMKTDLVSSAAAAGVRFGSSAQKAGALDLYARLRTRRPSSASSCRAADRLARHPIRRRGRGPEGSPVRQGPGNARADSDVRKEPWVPPMFRPLTRNMLDLDPPDHTRLRALVHRAFTPRLVEELGGRIESIAESLLERGAHADMDLIRDYALPIPTIIIAEMLGVPAADRAPVPPLVADDRRDHAVRLGDAPGDPERPVVPALHPAARPAAARRAARRPRERARAGRGGGRAAQRGRAGGDGLPPA